MKKDNSLFAAIRPLLLGIIMLTISSLSCNTLIPSAEVTLTPEAPQSSPIAVEKATATQKAATVEPATPTEEISLPTPTETQEQTSPDPQGSVLLVDDFEDSSSGWEIGDYDTGSVGYANGAYFVDATEDDSLMWGLAYKVFENTAITVETRQVSAPSNDNNGYGVMCRVQSNDDGYILRISGDGYAAIQYFMDGELHQLVEWFESPSINQGNAANTILAICDGPTLVLIVNGDEVARATDTTFTRGDIALATTSFEAEPTRILFDNIRVTLPDQP
ncbi:MAG: hypothetical protein JXA25_20295 [Anaerolineales bacterium]|nr:hypothetical protein [Anaerolineales bacterium]